MIRSALAYTRYMAVALVDPAARALVFAHRNGVAEEVLDRKVALRKAISYLLLAQRNGSDDGMGSYHLVHGWGASYPETTGYAIPTMIAAADLLQWHEAREAAVKAGEWLLSIQHADGGWQGGRVGEGRPSIVFNTAQVIRGMLAVHAITGEERFREAAMRAGRWIISVQDADGAWRGANFMGTARVYDTYVDAPLLQLSAQTGDTTLRTSALRNLDWVLAQQQPNGWFANADNTIRHNGRPITHTLAYTLDGLLECARILGDDRYAHAATQAAGALADQYLSTGRLHGRYDSAWSGSEHPLMTGCAQMTIVWTRLAAATKEGRFAEAATRMLAFLGAVQRLGEVGPVDARGALSGSFPLWGRYEKFAFPNWGTKYFADALLCAEGHPPAF